MTRGNLLEQDLRLLINDPKYSDIEILCEDEKKLYGCRAILAARSEVLDRLLYNGMKETYENKISFPEINSSGMEIVLEYIYTGIIQEESLTVDNIIEAFYAADYFQLQDLQDIIMLTVNDNLEMSPELLSKIAETMPLLEDNALLNLLVEAVAAMQLDTIEFGRLSIEGLECLLSYTHEREVAFVTPEYEVFRYSVILAAKQVSNSAYNTLTKQLPTSEQIKNSAKVEKIFDTDHQKVAKELEPLVKFIDLRRIKAQVLAKIIEPLKIIPTEIFPIVYREKRKSYFSDTRGTLYLLDSSACGSKLIIENNGRVVRSEYNCIFKIQNVRARMIFNNKGIFEWDVIIEKCCNLAWVGVCASENLNYEYFAGDQPTGWVLGSNGSCYNNKKGVNYCPPFGDGAKITVHLDMNKRTVAFTVNGTKYPEVSTWRNLPSKLYPVVSLCYPGRFRIQKTGL